MTEGRSHASVRRRVVEASAPCGLDLTGGALDAWPVYLFHPGAMAVTVAIDRRVWCRVETGVDGVEIESRDRVQKTAARTVAELASKQGTCLEVLVLGALGVESGVRVVTQTRVATGSRLGSSAALAVALVSALAKVLDRELDAGAIVSICRDVEVRLDGQPRGVRGYHTALRGGVVTLALDAGGVRAERARIDPARIEEALILVEPGAGVVQPDDWGLIKGQVEGDAAVRESLAELAAIAHRSRDALVAGAVEEVVALWSEEWRLRRRLAPEGSTEALERVVEIVSAAGGAARVSDGLLAVWAPPGERGPGRREAVAAALRANGLRTFPSRVDLRGLDVEEAA